MHFEEVVADRNADIFTREFTYTSSKFKSNSGQELELCDGAIWIDDLLILFQLKQRNPLHDSHDPETERKWFSKTIDKKAVGQFADTLNYLETERCLPLINRRGQTLDISTAKIGTIHLIVLYDASSALPDDVVVTKGRVSKRVGFVHYFDVQDYASVCWTLYTPFEISDYLSFREAAAQRIPAANRLSEKAMVGKYLSDTDDVAEINDSHEIVVDRLKDDRAEFSVTQLLHHYLDRIIYGNEGTQYHEILAELAKLKRNMMREFRKRLHWAMDKCQNDVIVKPSRFYPVEQGCCFISIPLPASERDNWRRHLEPLTHLCKYDFRSRRCLGFTVTPDPEGNDNYCVNWMLVDYPWAADSKADELLQEEDIFRESWFEMMGTYEIE